VIEARANTPLGARSTGGTIPASMDGVLPNALLFAYFERLVNTPYKRYVQIGESAHNLMLE